MLLLGGCTTPPPEGHLKDRERDARIVGCAAYLDPSEEAIVKAVRCAADNGHLRDASFTSHLWSLHQQLPATGYDIQPRTLRGIVDLLNALGSGSLDYPLRRETGNRVLMFCVLGAPAVPCVVGAAQSGAEPLSNNACKLLLGCAWPHWLRRADARLLFQSEYYRAPDPDKRERWDERRRGLVTELYSRWSYNRAIPRTYSLRVRADKYHLEDCPVLKQSLVWCHPLERSRMFDSMCLFGDRLRFEVMGESVGVIVVNAWSSADLLLEGGELDQSLVDVEGVATFDSTAR